MLANKSPIAGRIIGLIKWKAGTPFNASKIKSGHPLNILATIPATLPDSSSPQLLKKVSSRDLEGYFAYPPSPKLRRNGSSLWGGMKRERHLPISLFLNLVHVCLGKQSQISQNYAGWNWGKCLRFGGLPANCDFQLKNGINSKMISSVPCFLFHLLTVDEPQMGYFFF